MDKLNTSIQLVTCTSRSHFQDKTKHAPWQQTKVWTTPGTQIHPPAARTRAILRKRVQLVVIDAVVCDPCTLLCVVVLGVLPQRQPSQLGRDGDVRVVHVEHERVVHLLDTCLTVAARITSLWSAPVDLDRQAWRSADHHTCSSLDPLGEVKGDSMGSDVRNTGDPCAAERLQYHMRATE